MRKYLLVVLPVLFLFGCDQAKQPAADGYTFGSKQYEKQIVQIKIVTYPSQQALIDAARARGQKDPQIVAFAELRPPNFDTCTIHMIDPAVSYEPEFIGHELAHCVYGQWHSDNQSRG